MPSRPSAPHIQDLIAERLSRRGALMSLSALPALSLPALSLTACASAPGQTAGAGGTRIGFASVPAHTHDRVSVPEGYEAQVLIGWGDPLFDSAEASIGLGALTRAEQELRFGTNNDMLALFPATWAFPKRADENRFLLCANHEYFDPSMMFPGVAAPDQFTAENTAAMYASMGVSVVALAQAADGAFTVVRDEKPGAGLNRRVTPFSPVRFSGPAANHRWIRAAGAVMRAAEPGAGEGEIPCGTLSNCAGGETPWGTYLSAEENFDDYLFNTAEAGGAAAAAGRIDPGVADDAKMFGYPLNARSRFVPPGLPGQFDLSKNPTLASLYGWVVEIDPYDPQWTPRKRTALGRRKGECATTALTRDGRVAVYSGDDEVEQFVYKFISRDRFNPKDRLANRDLLDHGTLYVAQFFASGVGAWLPLTLETANAAASRAGKPQFADQGDVMIRAREAAALMGATPMDRPEDVEALLDANWVAQGPVLVVCTKNPNPKAARPGAPHRPDPETPDAPQPNLAGHVLRLDEGGDDAGALEFRWDVFVMGGDPGADAEIAETRSGARLHTSVADGGAATIAGDRFACPDNVCFRADGLTFISTDGGDAVFGDCNDAVLVTDLTAPEPRPMRRFLVGPVGSEVCGPTLTPDERTFLCAIQHPGEGDASGAEFSRARWAGAKPFSHWPDGGDSWPRSAVIAVRRRDGGRIGG